MEYRPTRREVFTVMGAGAVALFSGGCGTNENKNVSKVVTPSLEPVPTIELHVPVTNEEVLNAASSSVDIFSNAFDLELPKDTLLKNTAATNDLLEYQGFIAKSEEGYVPTDELRRPAVTDRGMTYYYLNAIENLLNEGGIPNSPEYRKQFIEILATHELAHQIAVEYATSSELHSVIFNKMFGGVEDLAGAPLGIVGGAKVHTEIDGVTKSIFQGVEEAEAIILGETSLYLSGGKRLFSIDNSAYFGQQVSLLKDLLFRLDGGFEQNSKMLAALRMQTNGREEWMRHIASNFGIPRNDQLFYSASLLFAIDIADVQSYLNILPSNGV